MSISRGVDNNRNCTKQTSNNGIYIYSAVMRVAGYNRHTNCIALSIQFNVTSVIIGAVFL